MKTKLLIAAILIVSVVGLRADWILNPVTPSITTNTALLSSNTLETEHLLYDTNGDVHVLMFYDLLNTFVGTTIQIFDANITQGTARLTNTVGASGRCGGTAAAFTNGWYYKCTGDDNGVAESFRYNPKNGQVQILHTNSSKIVQSMCLSDNGYVDYGEFPTGVVETYKLSDGTWKSWGQADTNYIGNAQYCYTIGADNRYIYAGLGQNPFYLAVIDTQTSNHWTYYSNLNLGDGFVQRGANGLWYYQTGGSYYQLINGTPVLTNSTALITWYLTNNNVYVDNSVFTDVTGKDFDFGFAYPDSTNNYASMRWATTGSNNWQSLTVSNFSLEAANIHRVYPNGDGRLFVMAVAYLPELWFTPSNNFVSVIGHTGDSLYDAVKNGSYWFLSGYADVTLRYDTGSAWTLTPSTTDKTAVGVNARQLVGGWGKYHYYSAFGSDGLLYIGAHHERDSVGGDIGWYNVSTLTAAGNLRGPFTASSDNVSELSPSIGAQKMVYLSDGDNKLFVFDVSTKNTTKTNLTILPELSTLDKCVEVSSGVVIGVSGNRVWKYNVSTDTVLYTNSLPGTAWSGFTYQADHRLVVGPDGYAWVTLGNDLYRIHPTTCAASLVKSGVGSQNVSFNNGDAYLYNPNSPQLLSLTSLLINNTTNGTARITNFHVKKTKVGP